MEAIVNNLIKAIGWSIFHSLWQGAIIYGILLLIVSSFPKLNAKIKHNLAYGALSIIFIGFCITFASIFQLPSPMADNAAIKAMDPNYYQYLMSLPQEINNRTENIFPYLVSLYAIGILFQLFMLSAGYQKLIDLKKADRIAVPSEWQTIFETLVIKLNLRQKISFHLSEKVNVPLVIGYLKPVVLFPIALTTQLDMQQVEAILVHELSHIRRNDYLLNLVKTGIETILFFNPFVWLSGKFINIEREHACDDLVLKFTGAPITYAHALLKLEILKDKASPAFSMAATGSNQHLYQRIKRITDMKTTYMNAKQKMFAFALAFATVCSLAWVNPTKNKSTEKLTDKKDNNEKLQKINLEVVALNANNLQEETCPQDTAKKKKKFKIVTTDENGNKKEYNSVKEMPDSLRIEVIDDTFLNSFKAFKFDSLTSASLAFVKSPEFKAEMNAIKIEGQNLAKLYNSEKFKHEQLAIKESALAAAKIINSPEFKAQQKEIMKAAMGMSLHLNSIEFKKQQEEIKLNSEKLRLKFTSPEFKKQIEELKELKNSPEYKELKKKFDEDIENIKKQKGIKSDLKTNNLDIDLNTIIGSATEDIAYGSPLNLKIVKGQSLDDIVVVNGHPLKSSNRVIAVKGQPLDEKVVVGSRTKKQ